ncbi:MAG: rhodanese-like domain-containing protein [Eubacterium sp.]|nr:rhodanese-like domain-containing protein [Eubacterium sp.]
MFRKIIYGKHIAFLASMLIAALFSGCHSEPAQNGSKPNEFTQIAEYRKITMEQAKEIMDGEEEHILLDVRTDGEWKENRIEGSLLIPDYEIIDRAADELPDKSALILIYCRSGRRSADAANSLVDMGYMNVYDFGGIIDWPYETVGGSEA